MDLLLHACCGPCSVYTTMVFGEEGFRPTLFYSNPNIHPYREWVSRRDNLKILADERGLQLWVDDEYELESFLRETLALGKERCLYCYRTRLERTARRARDEGYDSFSTTLLISPYQRHDELKSIGKELEKEHGVNFIYRDLRPGFRQSQEIAKAMGLYRQGYCGCIFSETERYRKSKKVTAR